MARNFGLPYKTTNPRSIRGAKKRGWILAIPNPGYVEKLSWMGLNIWCETHLTGYWVSNFHYRQFAFENPADATAFQLKWG